MIETKKSNTDAQAQTAFSPPSISLPKGGGAIRGIGEKFGANPVSGTGSMTVPIAVSPGRSGFGPQLSLSYDSGSGNGPFGFGWSLSLPAITRKTDKGLPQYRDAEESDVYILSGSEDLVPVLGPDGKRFEDVSSFPGYTVHRYRPRIEVLFARIERWMHLETGEIHWRSISRDNVTTLYGKDNNSRIFDPADPQPQRPTRIFSWLICESYDDKGNVIVYEHGSEDSRGVDHTQANERNRTPESRATNRYLKGIKYGNTISRLVPNFSDTKWLFEVVLDYGEGRIQPQPPDPEGRQTVLAHLNGAGSWPVRPDAFSSYRAGFEVRTYRICERILMFHHFKEELGVDNYLVRSTELGYERASTGSFLTSAVQSGYVAWPDPTRPTDLFLQRSLPPVEFEYSKPVLSEEVREIDPDSLENLPAGLDGSQYQWVDLDGEGLSGILTDQADTWFYKRNLGNGRFGPLERVAHVPVSADLGGGGQQLLDLSGDGQLDLTNFAGPAPGFYERTTEQRWETFTPFRSLPQIDWGAPNLRFADLTGDGHADVLVTEDSAFRWHPSLAEDGFGPEVRRAQPLDEEQGPRLVFGDRTQSIYLADLSGDGLSDLVRIRNGEVSYWPNLGYGHFGSRVTMDNSPRFDQPDLFDQQQVRLADIDGSGTTDILYLTRGGVTIYRNQSGNRWGAGEALPGFPPVDDLSAVLATDLLGTGTVCLVWSSSLPGNAREPIRFIDLMAAGKPHLLVATRNNLGAETRVQYVASTKFYLADRAAGRPWITKLPFPVHVVERVETWDWISRNRFVSSYAYHHGYFDGEEREFRGFGMIEQRDTEAFATLSGSADFLEGDNIAPASHVPPVLTKTWFHTGAYLRRDRVSNFFGGLLDTRDRGEYYREPAWRDDDVEAGKRLLDDTLLPAVLSIEDEREACRALKGAMLRQEVYALDGTGAADYPQGHPYTVTEQNFAVKTLQRRGPNRHGVFFTHASETINYQYERNPADPRISHAVTLEVDSFGNVLKEAAIGYGRRVPDSSLPLQADRDNQARTLMTYTEKGFTEAIEEKEAHRVPLPCEIRTYELTGYAPTGTGGRFQIADLVEADPNDMKRFRLVSGQELHYEDAETNGKQYRLIEHARTLYRQDDLSDLLPFGKLEPLALPGENYRLAFTPGLLGQIFKRPRVVQPPEDLLPVPADVLGGPGSEGGGYVASQAMKGSGAFPSTDADNHWWIPTGRVFYSPESGDGSAQELGYARQHFFVPRRYRDPFYTDSVRTESVAIFDSYDLLTVETRDALANRVTVGRRSEGGVIDPSTPGNDYRVLQARLVTDPNRNRAEVVYDALGMVVGSAVMGKDDTEGDTLSEFEPDLSQTQVDGFSDREDPRIPAPSLLKGATTRVLYDLDRFRRTRQAQPKDPAQWLPIYAATLVRETHARDPLPGQGLRVQISLSYSDGFGREIQKKIQAEPGPLLEGGPVVNPRWVGSGWTIYNNKGKPVRQYEPFFSQLPEKRHRFEFGAQVGVSSILFYDPTGRIVATLHPNNTYEKVVFDPWRQTTYDVNDTVAANGTETGDPRSDPAIRGYVADYFKPLPDAWQTWHQQRITGGKGPQEKSAAEKAAKHTNTPTTTHFDPLGRPFITLAHNGFRADGTPELYPTRVRLDIEGNQREVRDAIEQNGDKLGRIVIRYQYDMLANRIHQASMEAGERWMLNDAAGKLMRTWDSRGHAFRTSYDPLRRPLRSFVTGADPKTPTRELLTERLVYGEQHPEAELRNLRGRLYLHLDSAGIATNEAHDFKGNLLRTSRRLALEYKQASDWRAVDNAHAALPSEAMTKLNPVALETALASRVEVDTFTSSTRFDALNRPVAVITPDNSVIRPVYNEANLLERVEVNLRGTTVAAPFVTNIDYNAKGQRTLVEYSTMDGSGIATTYAYDRDTFRLVHLRSRRNSASFNGTDRPGEVQNHRYTYDPAGNIIHIQDMAQQTIYFNGQVVEPHCEYSYDALYRLIEAAGREHIGLAAQPETTWNDEFRARRIHPHDGQAMRNYSEAYEYDAVGNVAKLVHQAVNGNWTRSYTYNEPSLAEVGKRNNRVSKTMMGRNNSTDGLYLYDSHGNMVRLPHLASHPDPALPNMHWDYKDQLRQADKGGGGTVYYVCDAAGERVRKVWEKAPGLIEERIYLLGFEIFRRRDGAGAIALERETLHIMDDKRRLALVETRTKGTDASLEQLIRYQMANHLGCTTLELDRKADIITYEEYYPYGGTSYQAVRNQTETPKRYRYTGNERDEETGLYHHAARYYAPWLARWISCDPFFLSSQPALYTYASCNPITHADVGGRYDPSAFGKSLEAKLTQAENALLLEDRNIGTSLVNTAIATTATIAKGFLSILQVGTGAAQGVEDIKRGFSDKGDGWDVAIGVSRILSDAGEVASSALGVAGAGSKVAQTSKVALLKREVKLVQAERSVASTAQRATELSEKLGELNAKKEFIAAGYQSAGNLKRVPKNGGNVRQGVDQGYRNMKAFRGKEAAVEAKGLAKPPVTNQASALKTDTRKLVEGADDWNLDRLQAAANSGNKNAQGMLKRLGADAPESYLSVTHAGTGQTTVSRLRGAGTPVATPLPGLGNVSPVGEMVGAAVVDNMTRKLVQ